MSYDRIARNYDWLSRLVFGRAQVLAQTVQLPFIPAGSRLLIVGGGTGWILEELAQVHPSGLKIDYVEPSAAMLELARQNRAENSIRFYGSGIEDFSSADRYDGVLTFFLFDNFSAADARNIFLKLDTLLMPGGLWLYADFIPEQPGSPAWQKLMIRVMYLFFRLVCGIRARRVPAVSALFRPGYALKANRRYYRGFIESKRYCKHL